MATELATPGVVGGPTEIDQLSAAMHGKVKQVGVGELAGLQQPLGSHERRFQKAEWARGPGGHCSRQASDGPARGARCADRAEPSLPLSGAGR